MDEKSNLLELLKNIPNMIVDGRGMIEFTCFLCKPIICFPDIDQHMLHCEEIHLRAVSYKDLLIQHLGPEKSKMMGLEQRTEKDIIDLIKQFDRSIARRNHNGQNKRV